MKINGKTWFASNLLADNTARSHSLYMMKGTALTKTDIRNMIVDKASFYTYNELKAKLAELTATEVARIHYPNILPERLFGTDKMHFPLAVMPYELEVLSEDTPTWFIFVSHDNATIESGSINDNTTRQIHSMFVGTVGTIGSGADMEMVNPALNLTDDYKPGDINITLTGA